MSKSRREEGGCTDLGSLVMDVTRSVVLSSICEGHLLSYRPTRIKEWEKRDDVAERE
ncbi:hypothetical protein LINGRAHAP2_LOCUS8669, partial [Linum grandiflorum]